MTDNQATVLRLLERHPGGLTQGDIVLTAGLTPYAVTMAIRVLHRAHLAAPTQAGGPSLAWATPAHCVALRAEIARNKAALDAAKLARSAERLTRCQEAASRHYQQAVADEEADAFARPSIRRTVTQWERPAACVPFSVFNQGAAA